MTRDLFSMASFSLSFSRTASQRPSPSPARRPVRRFTPSLACEGLETRLAPSAMPTPFGAVNPNSGAFVVTFTGSNGDGGTTDGGSTGGGSTGTGTGIDTGTGTGVMLVGPDTPTGDMIS
jgi:hypothetical protein